MTPRWPIALFDLDGTVANTIPLILASYAHATRTVLGEAVPESESRSWIGQPLRHTFQRRYPDHVDALYDEYLTWTMEHLDALIETYDGMAELLDDLNAAGVVIGIVTSKRLVSAERTLQSVGLDGRIAVLASMADTENHKPAPDPLRHALTGLGRSASEAVYIGDAVVDVLCAHAAGADAIAVTWGAGLAPELAAAGPLAIIDELDALRALLLG